jgi:hypothetical protein
MNNSAINAAVQVAIEFGRTIRTLGAVRSGHLYATVMGVMDVQSYESCLRFLEKQGMIKIEGNEHLITWIAG